MFHIMVCRQDNFVPDLLPNVSTAIKPLADITVICVAAIFGLQRHPHWGGCGSSYNSSL